MIKPTHLKSDKHYVSILTINSDGGSSIACGEVFENSSLVKGNL